LGLSFVVMNRVMLSITLLSEAAKKGTSLAVEKEPGVGLRYGLFGRSSGPS